MKNFLKLSLLALCGFGCIDASQGSQPYQCASSRPHVANLNRASSSSSLSLQADQKEQEVSHEDQPTSRAIQVASLLPNRLSTVGASSRASDSSSRGSSHMFTKQALKEGSQLLFDQYNLNEDFVAQILSECPAGVKSDIQLLKQRNVTDPRDWPKKMLFIGHPGTGKTILALSIAYECGLPIKFFGSSWIADIYKASGDQKIISIFDNLAKSGEECVVVIDEMQSLVNKKDNINDSDKDILDTIWTHLDKYQNSKIFFIGALNYNEKTPEQMMDRFDQDIYEFQLPDESERSKIIEFYIKQYVQKGILFEPSITKEFFAQQTAQLSRRKIAGIFLKTSRQARSRNINNPAVTRADFEQAISNAYASKNKKLPLRIAH